MEALPAPAVAIALPAPEDVPWSFLIAFVSLGLVFLLYRLRPGVFAEMAMGGREVALLCLGSIAGGVANVPLWISGETYLMVNIGGTIVALLLIRHWIRHKKLPLLALLLGTALVTFIAWRIVVFDPAYGIVSEYPLFFLPIAGALAFALLLSIRKPVLGAPVAYASGSLGALVGADLLHVPDIHAHFANATTRTIISIGGAGVFDMVFLAGTSAMALHLLVVCAFGARGAPAPEAGPAYPPAPLTLRDSRRVRDHYQTLAHPNDLERAIAGLALSDLALKDGDYARSVRMSWLAVDNLLQTDPCKAHLARLAAPDPLRGDVDRLHATYVETRHRHPTLRQAGEANATAKLLLSALAPALATRHRLEGVA